VTFAVANRSFLTTTQLLIFADSMSALGMMAGGATVLMILMEFDLSIGSVASVAGVAAAVSIRTFHLQPPYVPALLAGLVTAAVIGLVNGVLVSRLRLPSFIATLAVAGVVAGAAAEIAPLFQGATLQRLQPVGNQVTFGIPNGFIFMLIEFGVLGVFLEQTHSGRNVYAAGGNALAASLRGINVADIRISAFVLMAVVAGLVGVLIGGSSGLRASPFDAITVVFLGAAVLRPGQFHILGTAVGLMLFTLLSNGLLFIGVGYEFQALVKGALLILAVAFARSARSHQAEFSRLSTNL
jgi:ribose/xylose/arabinose/galactoside ABC-type transport system permease subunit